MKKKPVEEPTKEKEEVKEEEFRNCAECGFDKLKENVKNCPNCGEELNWNLEKDDDSWW